MGKKNSLWQFFNTPVPGPLCTLWSRSWGNCWLQVYKEHLVKFSGKIDGHHLVV